MDNSTLIWRSRASVELSPTVFCSLILPLREICLVTNKILSSNVVFPLEYGPTIATLRVLLMLLVLITQPQNNIYFLVQMLFDQLRMSIVL